MGEVGRENSLPVWVEEINEIEYIQSDIFRDPSPVFQAFRSAYSRTAQEFFLSRPYLTAKFKRETGQTLSDFTLNEKTEEAKRLIRYTDKSLPAISAYIGFSSQSHFIRVFRKYAGSNPGEYIENHRK